MKKNCLPNLLLLLLTATATISCNKLLDIKDPVNSITTNQVFQNAEQAGYALNGLYSYLINGNASLSGGPSDVLGTDLLYAGGATIVAAHSADELYHPALAGNYRFYYETTNSLTLNIPGSTEKLWLSAYKGIYNANALIDGVNESTSRELTETTKQRVKGEAMAIRALGYFYLVNLFEKIPLVLTIDFNKTKGLPSATREQVYAQIISDLETSISYLSDKYDGDNKERIRVNKWFAKALLARVYLYQKNYNKAYEHSNDIINATTLFKLEDLNTVFKYNSNEVIFQLKQDNTYGNGTREGYAMYGKYMTPQLLSSFETGDKRRTAWTTEIPAAPLVIAGTTPAKYKINLANFTQNGFRSEYYVMMRLAEMYLIRAEATLLQSVADKNKAIDDLNTIRRRADLGNLPYTLTETQVIAAIAQERRIELFAEWGHRWLDLRNRI